MNKITGSKILVNTLEKLKVDRIFGIPGIHNLDIYEAMIDSNIHHITARNESGAGFMADGFARSTGKPGVALVITGPGLTNIMTPMGQAFHDSIPMVVISSQVPTTFLDQGAGFLHELKNSTIMVKSVAKESRTVLSADAIGVYLEEAYYLSMTGRPGPVHIEIPMDILRELVDDMEVPNRNLKFSNPVINEDYIIKASDIINTSKTAMLIVGGGAVNCGKEILELANKISAPVIQTTAGKGIVDETHALCIGSRLHFDAVKDMLMETDVVIAIGTQLSPTDLWEVPLSLHGTLIQIDIDPGQFNRNYRADIGIKGDARDVLNALISKLNYREIDGVDHKVSEIIVKTGQQIKKLTGMEDSMDFIKEMLEAIRRILPKDGILCTDMTTSSYVAISEFPSYMERTFLHPVGFGTLGHALPAGIGAKLANPEKVVLVLEGDGGFQFTMQELSCAIEEGISLPVIVWDNGGFGEIRRNERARNFSKNIAVDNSNPNFLKLADAYGIRGFSVSNGKEMEEALIQAIEIEGVSLIVVNVTVNGG